MNRWVALANAWLFGDVEKTWKLVAV